MIIVLLRHSLGQPKVSKFSNLFLFLGRLGVKKEVTAAPLTTLVVLMGLVLSLFSPLTTLTQAASVGIDWQNRHIIFIDGIQLNIPGFIDCSHDFGFTDSYGHNNVANNFGDIRDSLMAKAGFGVDKFHYFSYSSDYSDHYNCGDTEKSIINGSADRFNRLIQSVLNQSPTATFDVIAHSMGGVVAIYWAYKSNYMSRIHSIITLDSPIHGITSNTWCAAATACTELGPTSPLIKDILPAAAKYLNVFYSRNFLDGGGPIPSVPPQDSYIDDGKELLTIEEPSWPSKYGKRDAHSAILSEPNSLNAMVRSVTSNYYRFNSVTLAPALAGSWSYWNASWLFGGISGETSTLNSSASIDVPAQHRYVVWRTQQDKGRGSVNIYVNGKYWRPENLHASSYSDVELCYDLGSGPHNFKIVQAGGGSFDLNSFVTTAYKPDDSFILGGDLEKLFKCSNGVVTLPSNSGGACSDLVGNGAANPQAFINAYVSLGAIPQEGCPQGQAYATSSGENHTNGWEQAFNGGSQGPNVLQMLNGTTIAFEIRGGIYTSYQGFGGVRGNKLGFAIANEDVAGKSPYGGSGYWQRFQQGAIYWNNQKAHGYYVINGINHIYESQGGSSGRLGFPISSEYNINNGWRNDFEGGSIEFYSNNTSRIIWR
jgi:pimeloyl-ACP methyl ester carboxylesterase